MAKPSTQSFDVTGFVDYAASQFRNLNPNEPGQWPPLPKIATWLVACVAVVAGGWFALLSTATDELEALRLKEPQLKTTYKDRLGQAVNLGEYRKQKLQVQEYVTQLEKQLPGKAEMDALLSDINQAGLGRGLQFELFRPGQMQIKDYYAELPIAIRVTGRYHDIGSFAADVANLSRIVTLQDLTITPVGPRDASGMLAMDATARTYRYLDPSEIAAQKQPPARAPGGREVTRPAHPLGPALVGLALLAGCGADHDELRGWMEQQRREAKPSVAPLQPPKRFDPQPYTAAQAVEPFSTQKLSVALKQEARQPNSMLSAELNRRKEPLESYPLDSMSMVGSVNREGKPFALLRVDNLLYQVKVGDHLGQNYGLITKITETEIVLRELVMDAGGEMIERPATLQLQERAR